MTPDLPLFQYQQRPHVPKPCGLERQDHCEMVLAKLRTAGERGVSIRDFPENFALRSRISDLRIKYGYLIDTNMKVRPTRYVLLGRECEA